MNLQLLKHAMLNLVLAVSLALVADPVWAGGMDDGNLPDFQVPENPYSNTGVQPETTPAETTPPASETPPQEPDAKPSKSKTKAAPVKRMKKPLQGGVEQSELKGDVDQNALNGNASDYGDLNQGQGTLDQGQPMQGGVDDNGPMELGASNDPDGGNQELEIAWDRWRNTFMQTVQAGTIEKINVHNNVHFVWDPRTQMMQSRYPLGTSIRYSATVLPNRKLVDVKLIQRSAYPTFDQAVMQSIYELQGKKVLQYPKGSKRQTVTQEANLSTAAQSNFQNFQFGDVERQSW